MLMPIAHAKWTLKTMGARGSHRPGHERTVEQESTNEDSESGLHGPDRKSRVPFGDVDLDLKFIKETTVQVPAPPGACAAPPHRNRKHPAHGLLSLCSLLRALLLTLIKRNQAEAGFPVIPGYS